MKKIYVFLLLLTFFILGVAVSSPIKNFLQIFQSTKSKDCISSSICVGDKSSVIFGYNAMDGFGGLDTIFCGKTYDKGNIEYLFLSDILLGTTCKRTEYTLSFASERNITSITIRDGVITELKRGPLHILDL